jgi:hypothetical protein
MLQALTWFCVGFGIGVVSVTFLSMQRRLKRLRGFERMMDAMTAMGRAAQEHEKKLKEQREKADWN